MANRVPQYLFLYHSLAIAILETGPTGLGSGKTLTATFSSVRGTPTVIGAQTATATAFGGYYTITFARSGFLTDLSPFVGKRVWLFLDDAAAWRDVYEFQVTDIAPDLLTQLLS